MFGREREIADFLQIVGEQEGVGLFVGQALAGADDGVGVGGGLGFTVFGEGEEYGFAEAVLRFDERAEAVGKFFRQHRNDGADQVGRVPARLSLAIEGGVGADVAGNVGDVDADARVAFRGDFVGERVVKIFGVVGVDREDRDLAVIDSAGGVFGGDAVGQGSGFALDVGGETGREIKFFVDTEELRARFVGAPEARGDRAGELFAAVGPVVEFDDDFVANRDFDRGGLNEDRLDETWIVGRHDE